MNKVTTNNAKNRTVITKSFKYYEVCKIRSKVGKYYKLEQLLQNWTDYIC